jgi:CBS domain-containing protein
VLLINNIRRLPVMENGKIVGIVTTKKLYKNFLKSLL